MRRRKASIGRRALGLALALAALTQSGPAAGQQAGWGSAVPCAVPIAWRLARVDEEFGVGAATVATSVERAAEMWNSAVGSPLFVRDDQGGFPIRLVFDGRQQRIQAKARAEAELVAAAEALDADGRRLRERSEAHEARAQQHRDSMLAHNRDVAVYNDSVRAWNGRGGAPAAVADALQEISDSLASRGARLASVRADLESRADALDDDRSQQRSREEQHRRRVAELAAAYPAEAVESGVYREMVRTRDDVVESVSREIRVYGFGGIEELVLILAHEFGHALGLEHVAESGAVMNAQHVRTQRQQALSEVSPSDVRALGALCPGLGG